MEKKFDPILSEKQVSKIWEKANAFGAGKNAKNNKGSFSIIIPPPNVTGSLHMGHAFNNTLQDILTRWHRMRGFDTLWQPGQDHAGIATQMVVERELSNNNLPERRKLGREKFLEKVWEWKEKSGSRIIEQLKRLGASCDWERNKFTMDKEFQNVVIKVFVKMYNQGLIYRDKRMVNWDPHFETAISDLEVEQIEVKGKLYFFKYKFCDDFFYKHKITKEKISSFESRNYLVVATTRPETLLGDVALAVNPEDKRYSNLVGKEVFVPMVNRRIPIIADQHADPMKGSGVVKITPSHDFNDWEVSRRHNLRSINILDTKAKISIEDNLDFNLNCSPQNEIKELDSLDRFEARKKLLQLSKQFDWLDNISEDTHMVPHGDRSGVPIEPYLTFQWFVDTKKIVKPAIDAVKNGKTKITPKQDEKVYFKWLEEIQPWCISRQLWWGHRIPVWYDEKGNAFCAENEEQALILSEGKKIFRDPDVLDTWFSSGLWPIGTLGWEENENDFKKYYPTSVLVTGFDIIFFWVARMMMMQLSLVKEVPFKEVYVHALVRDEKGKKMSKSKGNVLDPLVLIDKYGADAVRFTLTALAVTGRDIRLSEERISGYRNFGTKLWNAARFAKINNCFLEQDFSINNVKFSFNRWIISETISFKNDFDKSLLNYKFNDAANFAFQHVWKRFCDWYIEFVKPFLNGNNSEIEKETKNTISWVLDQSLILLHPIMPFITEKIWNDSKSRNNLLVHEDWPSYNLKNENDENFNTEINWMISLIEKIRSLRTEFNIPPKNFLKLDYLCSNDQFINVFESYDLIIKKLGRIEEINKVFNPTSGCLTFTIDGYEFFLNVSGFLNLKEEINRLKKIMTKHELELNLLQNKMQNSNFVSKAPRNVVEDTEERIKILETDLQKINVAYRRIENL